MDASVYYSDQSIALTLQRLYIYTLISFIKKEEERVIIYYGKCQDMALLRFASTIRIDLSAPVSIFALKRATFRFKPCDED